MIRRWGCARGRAPPGPATIGRTCMSPTTGRAAGRRGPRRLARILVGLRAAAVLLPVAATCACGTFAPPASSSRPPQPAPRPAAAQPKRGCQATFVPSYFYSGGGWIQAMTTRPAPGVMLLNVDNGVGSAPLAHFKTLVDRAQAAGITVLGYSSTLNGQRPAAEVEAEVAKYKAWYGVNGIFLDLTRGTASELSYYR